ncbi:CCC motif membrane protein [Robertkochia solimangrovi]|uniref:CCC motif membrane protein n=1 Tax=Robertkochia solimangrovi TaxID=2213046 RepID=UPI00118101F7|nr:CCC motif membrane protein [Robertkochia solimangrovi]TRZ43768.1 DUF4190 domain-containing protein [Robertkochia solimangrovi]
MEQKMPNTTLIIILGIFGYICCCFAGLGIIPSVIAFFLSRKAEQIYAANPEVYQDKKSTIQAGKIVAIIAVVLNVLLIARIIYNIASVGWDEWIQNIQDAYQEAMEQAAQQQ